MAGCVGQPSHFPFPCHFALLFSLVIFFQILKGPGAPLQRKRKFSFLPPFSRYVLPFPLFPSPSLRSKPASPLSHGEELRSGSEKKIEKFLFSDLRFSSFFSQNLVESNPTHLWFDVYTLILLEDLCKISTPVWGSENLIWQGFQKRQTARYRTKNGCGSILLPFY